jgi:hypothetical protein
METVPMTSLRVECEYIGTKEPSNFQRDKCMYLGVPTVRVATYCKAYHTPLAVLEDSRPDVAQLDMKLFLC